MDLAGSLNREVVNELKLMGVKCRKEKMQKQAPSRGMKLSSGRVFRTPIHLLELSDVILADGSVVQIPKFIAEACNRISEQVEIEGIFRKAGSSIRQKEMRMLLDSGIPLGRSHHVIDVANVVKYFFRELPEPLIASYVQETLLRALLVGENHEKAIILTCLLLPKCILSTLRFFMQFLHTVARYQISNKMSMENLAIIFTPSLMPFANINSHRFTNHIKVVHVLIKCANLIGSIPNNITSNLVSNQQICLTKSSNLQPLSKSTSDLDSQEAITKKKTKRRSGSLTHMFIGFKKMIGSTALDSVDYVESNTMQSHHHVSSKNVANIDNFADVAFTPIRKSNKLRYEKPFSGVGFSSKKKRGLLAILPSDSGGFLPNTPITKTNKKSRVSLTGHQQPTNVNVNTFTSSMERRWSIVGTGWSKHKKPQTERNKQILNGDDHVSITKVDEENVGFQKNKDFYVVKNQHIQELNDNHNNKSDIHLENRMKEVVTNHVALKRHGESPGNIIKRKNKSDSQLENRRKEVAITNHVALKRPGESPGNMLKRRKTLSGLADIQTQYERILQETAFLSLEPKILPQLYTRGVKVRRRSYQPDIRSPSARKIGSLRRRSLDKNKSRYSCKTVEENQVLMNTVTSLDGVKRQPLINSQTKENVEQIRYGMETIPKTPKACIDREVSNEKWISGDCFFRNTPRRQTEVMVQFETPIIKRYDRVKRSDNAIKEVCVNNKFLLPATTLVHNNKYAENRSIASASKIPTVNSAIKTPIVNSAMKTPIVNSAFRTPIINRFISTPADDDLCGRASISRLRTLNAGMVMAKARLFDNLDNCNVEFRPGSK